MKKIVLFVAKVAENIRGFLSNAFDKSDELIDQAIIFLKEYGDPMTEFLHTNAVKLERAIPEHGWGSDKAKILDQLLINIFIPGIEKIRGIIVSEDTKKTLLDIAKSRAAKFVADRNKENDWQYYIDELNRVESVLGIKK